MKISFLGTGSISSLSNSSSLLINSDILIDCGNGIYKALLRKGVDVKNIHYIIITHLHGDHIFDIPPLLFGIYSKNPHQEIVFIGNRHLKEAVLNLLKIAYPVSWDKINNSLKINYINSEELKGYKISNNILLDSFSVHHGSLPGCFGYIINGIIAVTGDCSYNEGIFDICRKVNYLICDCTRRTGDSSHMGVNNIKEISKNGGLTIYPTHMSQNSKNLLLKTYFVNKNVFIVNDYDTVYI